MGFRGHREMLEPPKQQEAFIIPPDPAIIEAGLQPGERVYDDPKVKSSELPRHAHTVPLVEMEKASEEVREEETVSTPNIYHAASEPSRVADKSRAPHTTSSSPRRYGHASPDSPQSLKR